ncbi:MAG: YjbH domain-containing protein, partial [Gammaproteobacteria bacterium]|nr:YjbH domain-containing protein [Gammaproteobacteria bacterium]
MGDMIKELRSQDYRNIKLRLDGNTMDVSFTNRRISQSGRQVGRAARTILALGPSDISSLKITLTQLDLPIVTYTFVDIGRLRGYFKGDVTARELQPYVGVSYASADYMKKFDADAITDLEIRKEEKKTKFEFKTGEKAGGAATLITKDDPTLGGFAFRPFNLGFFFNDPSGAIKYDLFSLVGYRKRVGKSAFFTATGRFSLFENVSDVNQPSNSLLPHVRSDVGLYRDETAKILSVDYTKLFHLSERLYARASVGLFEEMFGGIGGQLLYLPKEGNWAIDGTLDWVKQRSFDGFGFRDYDTVTALANFHYRIPKWGITTTLRAGRFLARDEGVRFEFSREFRSGIYLGFWYTYTNADDITSPGSPGDPYQDKGIFLSIPFKLFYPKDARARAGYSIRPWTRDGGQ